MQVSCAVVDEADAQDGRCLHVVVDVQLGGRRGQQRQHVDAQHARQGHVHRPTSVGGGGGEREKCFI